MLKDLHTGSFDLDAQCMKKSYSMGQTQCFLSAQNQQRVLAPEIHRFCMFFTAISILAGAEKEQIFLLVLLHKLDKQKLDGRRKSKLPLTQASA